MQAERPDLTYATVLRQMQIMHAKGLLKRDESERSHRLTRRAQHQHALQPLVKDLIQKVFSGFGQGWCWPPCARMSRARARRDRTIPSRERP